MTALGVYVGNDPALLNKFTGWLGDAPDYVHGVVGYSNWKDYTSSANWQLSLWKPTGVDIQWSIPLISKEGNLGTAASGAYNQYYRSVAETLLKGTPGDGPIIIRTGWEANGDWFFWSAEGKEEEFKGAFQQLVTAFREVSDRFVFEWNINYADGGIDPETIYPGDEYVDIIGMDFYYKEEYLGSDPDAAFAEIRDAEYGLQWLEDFAAEHGKETAYSEWGVEGDSSNSARFIELAAEWFEENDVLYQSYWDSDAAFEGKLSDGGEPKTGAAYKEAFANTSSGEITWDDMGGKNTDQAKAEAGDYDPTENVSGDQTAGRPPEDDAKSDDSAASDPGGDQPSSGGTTDTSTPTPSTGSGAPALSAAPVKEFWGSSTKETISGSAGHDQINGGGGDTLKGGLGDDTYVITTGDLVVEAAGQGIETVMTWINNYVLPENVENLVLTGTGWNTLTGNALNNRLTGNLNPNTLNGEAGHDWLTGGNGADTFVIARGEGNDTVTDFSVTSGDVIRLDGFAFKDFAALEAAASQSGSDVLISLGDGQTLKLLGMQLASLKADDFALVNIKAPVPTAPAPTTPAPSANDGQLPDSAAATKWFFGTSKAETLTGSSGHDAFKGEGGGDTLKGGLGDDTYVVYAANDKVVELAGQGTDTVETWLSSYTLPDHVENLMITGTSWTTATGNALANKIIGNSSQNTLDGRGGNDVLTGGGGNDTFVIGKDLGHDLITDFQGAGKAGGDILKLTGFGVGATIAHEEGNLFAIHAANGSIDHVTLQGVTSLSPSDYVFG